MHMGLFTHVHILLHHISNTQVTCAITQSHNLDEIEGWRCIWIWLALFGIKIQFHVPVFVSE